MGTFLWREDRRRERKKVVFEEALLAMAVVGGWWGLWRSRGVWGWVGIPVGLLVSFAFSLGFLAFVCRMRMIDDMLTF